MRGRWGQAGAAKNWKLVPLLLLGVLVALLVVLCVDLFPVLLRVVKNSRDETTLTHYFTAYGFKGVPILISLQVLCVVLVVVPDSPIQLLAGICYGILGGMLVSLAGILLGNLILFGAVRLLGRGLPQLRQRQRKPRRAKREHTLDLAAVQNAANPGRVALLLYLIPGIPSGPLPYLMAKSRIALPAYLLNMALGSLPGLLFTTLIGKMVDLRNYTAAVVLALVYGLLLLAAAFSGKKILKKAGLLGHRVQ